jgi:hypothetical protein
VLCKLYKKLCKTLQRIFECLATRFVDISSFQSGWAEEAFTFQSAALPTELSRLKLVSNLGFWACPAVGAY